MKSPGLIFCTAALALACAGCGREPVVVSAHKEAAPQEPGFVTHDPLLALLSDRRIVMRNGAVESILELEGREKRILARISELDGFLSRMREKIRAGELLDGEVPPS